MLYWWRILMKGNDAMQRLNRGMMGRYEIPERFPARVNAVQFGLGERLLGVADKLLDEARAGVGIAALSPAAPQRGQDPAALLREQDGMYTVFTRGYLGETPVNREEVAQAILALPESVDAVAGEAGLALAIVDADAPDAGAALDMAARLLEIRRERGLGPLTFLCVGEGGDMAERVRSGLLERAPGLTEHLAKDCAFFSALADGLALRAEAKEAARLCEGMNYLDGMIHLAEPGARLVIEAPAGFRERWPLDRAEGVEFTDDLMPFVERKRRLFDAGLFLMAAPGWLLGLNTLADCMRHEALRAFVGRAYMEELLPESEAERAGDAPYVIRAFERFENPLNDNAILRAAAPLLGRFRAAALPLIKRRAEERFEPPRRLAFALAATVMLCAGARPDEKGRYEVLRGSERHALSDDPAALAVFATLSHDMPPEALAYAALADRELWGEDLREIDSLEQRVALDIANMQRNPRYLPE